MPIGIGATASRPPWIVGGQPAHRASSVEFYLHERPKTSAVTDGLLDHVSAFHYKKVLLNAQSPVVTIFKCDDDDDVDDNVAKKVHRELVDHANHDVSCAHYYLPKGLSPFQNATQQASALHMNMSNNSALLLLPPIHRERDNNNYIRLPGRGVDLSYWRVHISIPV